VFARVGIDDKPMTKDYFAIDLKEVESLVAATGVVHLNCKSLRQIHVKMSQERIDQLVVEWRLAHQTREDFVWCNYVTK
jgi:hypothetical protein